MAAHPPSSQVSSPWTPGMEPLGTPRVADAILDRLVHNAHRLQLTGESMRKRSAKTITLDGQPEH
ncbi:hypothetical protein ABIF66_001620 [Bradyrhizobium japonicum]